MIVEIAETYFIDSHVTLFWTSDLQSSNRTLLPNQENKADVILKTLTQENKWTFTQYDDNNPLLPEKQQIRNPKISNVITILYHVNLLSKIVTVLKQTRILSYKTSILVMCFFNSTNEQTTAQDVLRYFWINAKAVNVTVLTQTRKLFTWYPYGRNSSIVFMQPKQVLFPNKIPKDFRGFPIIVTAEAMMAPYVIPRSSSTDKLTGLEITLMDIIKQKCNFSVEYTSAEKGENPRIVYTNDGSTHGLFKQLSHHKADLAFGGMMRNPDRFHSSETLFAHTQDKLIWTYPAPQRTVSWTSLFRAFSLETWLTMTVIIGLNSGIIKALGVFHNEDMHFQNFNEALLSVWGVTLDFSFLTFPKSFPLKWHVIFVLFYSLIMSCSYKSCLVTFLTTPSTEKAIVTVYNALEQGLNIVLHTSSKQSMQNDDTFWKTILFPNRHFFSQNTTENLEKVAILRNSIYLAIYNPVEYLKNQIFIDDAGRPMIKYFKELFNPFSTSMFMAPGHPLEALLNDLTMRLVEADIVNYHLSNIMLRAKLEGVFKKRGKLSEVGAQGNRAITLHQLSVVFFILCLVFIFSTIAFVLEVLQPRLIRRNKSMKVVRKVKKLTFKSFS